MCSKCCTTGTKTHLRGARLMPITGLSHYLIQNPTLTLLLICHFLSDFQLQNQTVADRKNTDRKYLMIHLFGVAFPLILVTCFFTKPLDD